MKKSCAFIISLFILVCSLFSMERGLFNKNVRVSKTQWFDIIYTAEGEVTAQLLYNNADSIYEDVTGMYGLTPKFRMPVVIVNGVQSFNAFWSAAPYNHIVIYDTSTSGVPELMVFSETVLSVFRHELTHAVTNNMKNAFWTGVTSVIGDVAVPGLLYVNTGMAEGATVTSESIYGEGRLNSEYSKQIVKQAKLENKFPKYSDVIGSGDKYPAGAPYYFYGAFHQWLQEKYGMEAYAQFWYNVVNLKRVTLEGSFKKAYGIKLKTAWKYFMEDYPVPDIPGNPVEAKLAQDFFASDGNTYSRLNNTGALYDSLSASEKWVAWIDSASGKVQYVEADSLEKNRVTVKTLGTVYGVQKVSGSPDGRFMALSCYGSQEADVSAYIKIYDTETKRYFTFDEKSLKEGTIVQHLDDYYIVAEKFISPNNGIYVAKLVIENNRITAIEKISFNKMEMNTVPFSFIDCGDGKFACIQQKGLEYSILVYDIYGSLLETFDAPEEKLIIRDLSFNDGNIYFSWAAKNTMPRLGKLSLETGIMRLDDKDLSGGIYSPVMLKDKLVYIGNFYKQNRLLQYSAAFESTSDYEYDMTGSDVATADENQWSQEQQNELITSIPYKKYNAFEYLKRGIFIPLSLYETEYFGSNSAYKSDIKSYPIGVTYITANPWTDGSNDLYYFTTGWNYLNEAVGTELILKHKTNTSLLSTTFDLKNEFDKEGWKLSSGLFSVGAAYPFGNFSTIQLANDASARIGRQDSRNTKLTVMDEFAFFKKDYAGCVAPKNDTIYYSISDLVTAAYSNIHKTGPGRYEKAGFSSTLGVSFRKDESFAEIPVRYTNGITVTSINKVYLPKLIPVNCNYGFIYNLPSKLEMTVFPLSSNLSYTGFSAAAGSPILDLKAETILFGLEIQKAIPFLSALYVNDLYVSLGYSATYLTKELRSTLFQVPYLADYLKEIPDGNAIQLDSVYLKSVFEITPNFGLFASSGFKMDFYTMLVYSLHNAGAKSTPFSFYLGFQSVF